MAIPNVKNESEFEKVVNMAMKQVLDDTTINDISIREWIDKITSGEYKLVKHGHWKKEEDFIGEKYRCTMCKKVIRYDRAYVCQGELIFDFCPFCNADMRG